MQENVVQANRWKFFTVGAVGTFMATFDGSILNVALPTITADFETTVSMVAWTVLSYSLTLISLMLIFGAWTEQKGYTFAYKFGYYFFIVGSLLCAVSFSIHMLIFARVVQAIGTAMFAAIGPGMVSKVFPPNERGKGLGLHVMMVAGGFMIGPPVGGLLLTWFSWHWIFLINIPIGIFGLSLVYRYFRILPPHVATRKLHLPGALAISLSLVSGVFMLTLLKDYAVTDIRIWGLTIVSILSFVAWLRAESKPETALIGLEIFKRNRTFTYSLLSASAHFMGTSGVFVLIPFYLENIRGFEPKQVGLFLIILPILMFVLSPLSGKLSDKIGFRYLTVGGMLVTALGLWLLSGLQPDSGTLFIVSSLVVIGLGIGFFGTPNSSAMMGAVTDNQRATASGILATNRNIGMSVGIALSTSLFTYLQKEYAGLGGEKAIFVASYRPVIFVGLALCLVGAVFCLYRGERAT
ncbi:MAG: MFS transporter [candidate division Zixibacteria bacterium]|nr:MFS transporter [candidate division Zixibacteria bacterium]